MPDKPKMFHLVDPNGVDFDTDDPGLANSLLLAHGYTERSAKKSAKSDESTDKTSK